MNEITISEKYVRKYDNQAGGRTILVLQSKIISEQETGTGDFGEITGNRILGRIGGTSGDVQQLNATEVRTITNTLEAGTTTDKIRNNELLDGRYGRLTSVNTWTEDNSFNRFGASSNLHVERTDGAWFRITAAYASANCGTVGNHEFAIRTHAYNRIVIKGTGEVCIGGGVATDGYDFDVEGISLFQNNVDLTSKIAHEQFSLTTDFSGTNWEATAAGDFNIRNLVVRESARFRELIIDQLSVIAGSQLLSAARGKIKSVSGVTVTLEDPNNKNISQFAVNDFFWIKTVDIDGGIFSDVKGQISDISGVTLTLNLSVAGASGSMSDIQPGDVIVQRGHPTTTARQNLIYKTVSDNDAPVEKYFTGINTLAAFNSTANIRLQLGNLTNAPSVNNVSPSGMGLYADNVFLTGRIVLPSAGMTDEGALASSVRIYAGSTYANRSSAVFRVLQDGKMYASAGEVAGWVISATQISKESGDQRTVLSSAEQSLSFWKDDSDVTPGFKERAKIGIAEITGLTTLRSGSGVQTLTPTYSQSRTPTSMYVAYTDITGTFTVSEDAMISSFCKVVYTPHASATNSTYIAISGTVKLLNTSNVVLKTLGTFEHVWNELGTYTEWITSNDVVASGSYKLQYDYVLEDWSKDNSDISRYGTWTLGGSGNNHRVEWFDDTLMGTKIGQDGMYSFWGANNYVYINPKEYYTIQMQGSLLLMSQDQSAFMYLRGGTAFIRGNDAIYLYGNVTVTGSVTASAYHTNSEVADSDTKALQLISNLPTWKNKDGTINYENHYAHSKDDKGRYRLSVDTRIAMLEKMIYELSMKIN